MSTAQDVKTQFTTVDGIKIAYRRFGKASTYPLLYLNHFRGCMDTVDPGLFNEVAKTREVLLFDNFGLGHSGGSVHETINGMAATAAKFLAAIDVPVVDVIGFSLGGGVAQVLAFDHPEVVHKLVLAGTQSAIGEGVVLPPKEVMTKARTDIPFSEEEMLELFFMPTETSLAIGRQWWKRIHERNVPGEERGSYLVGPGVSAHLTAIYSFTVNPANFDRLKDIKSPTLVTNGHTDIMTPSMNSFILQQEIPNAQLILYPDAGHGHLFQYPELYAKHLDIFLSNP